MENLTVSRSQIMELACELAHERTKANLLSEEVIFTEDCMYQEDENGNWVYTEIVQDEFNNQYDYYLSTIENILK